MSSANLGLRARARLGTTLRGKYTLESVLGTGGMAVVFRARHRNNAEFAIKMLLPEAALDDEIRARFLREGYAANTVKHPGVVAIVDDDVAEDGAPFLVMELLKGRSAETLVEVHGGVVPPWVAAAIGAEVLDVLASAHAAGIVHRDIKPANVFVTNEGAVKVLDFGIARVRDAATQGAKATQTGVSFGTPAFMSPEQARGRSRDITERVDLWAVGASMFTMITGKLVHEGEGGQEILIKLATTQAPSLLEVAPHAPPELARVIDRALRLRPEERWTSASEMRAALLQAASLADLDAMRGALASFCASAPKSPVVAVDDATTRKASPANANVAFDETVKGVTNEHGKRPAPRAAIAAAVASFLLVGAVGVALLQRRTVRDETRTADAPHSTQPPPAVSTVAIQTMTRPSAPAASTNVPSVPIDALPVAGTTHARPPQPTARPSASVASPVRDACKPNYWLDDAGTKHFKPECF